jgi:hypothetical protein
LENWLPFYEIPGKKLSRKIQKISENRKKSKKSKKIVKTQKKTKNRKNLENHKLSRKSQKLAKTQEIAETRTNSPKLRGNIKLAKKGHPLGVRHSPMRLRKKGIRHTHRHIRQADTQKRRAVRCGGI